MKNIRVDTIPTRKSSRISSLNSEKDIANKKLLTHLASAVSVDNPFVILALEQIQAAIVDDKSPTKHMLDKEDYEPPTRRLMLQCKQRVKWEETEQDELRTFHLCNVLLMTPVPEGGGAYMLQK